MKESRGQKVRGVAEVTSTAVAGRSCGVGGVKSKFVEGPVAGGATTIAALATVLAAPSVPLLTSFTASADLISFAAAELSLSFAIVAFTDVFAGATGFAAA